MDMSFKLAGLLEDLEIDYESVPAVDGNTCLEFTYEGNFYNVEFEVDGVMSVNGEVTTYKDFILSTF